MKENTHPSAGAAAQNLSTLWSSQPNINTDLTVLPAALELSIDPLSNSHLKVNSDPPNDPLHRAEPSGAW